MQGAKRAALFVAPWLFSLAACGTQLHATRVQPVPEVRTRDLDLRAPEVHLSADLRSRDFSPASRVLVTLDVTAMRATRLDLRQVTLSLRGTDGRTETELPIATGTGEPPGRLVDGKYAPVLELSAGQFASVWVAFGGFLPRADRELQERVVLELPDGTRMPLATPGEPPRWEGKAVPASAGLGWWIQVSDDETSFNALFSDLRFTAGPLVIGTYYGIGVRTPQSSGPGGERVLCCTVGLGAEVGWPLLQHREFAIGPFIGGEASLLTPQDRAIERRNWFGPTLGLEFAIGRLLPRHGPFPVHYPLSNLGAMSLRIGLVHWFGHDRDVPSFGLTTTLSYSAGR